MTQIIPGKYGFGMDTRAAYGALNPPIICVITDTGDSGGSATYDPAYGPNNIGVFKGTLHQLLAINNESGGTYDSQPVQANSGKIILLEKSGTIHETSGDYLYRERYPYVSIQCQTNTNGLQLRNIKFSIDTHDVFIAHMRFRAGGELPGYTCEYRDSLGITAGSGDVVENIVIHHCDMMWGADENLEIYDNSSTGSVNNVTISECLIGEGLKTSCHPEAEHSKGMMIGASGSGQPTNVCLLDCLISHNIDRNPMLADSTNVVVGNCLIYNSEWQNIQWTPHNVTSVVALESNASIGGLDSGVYADDYITTIWQPYLDGVGSELYVSGSRVGTYTAGVLTWNGIQTGPTDHSLIDNRFSIDMSEFMQTTPTITIPNRVYRNSGEVLTHIINNVGAFPAYRDAVENRIISDIQDGSGNIIDVPGDVGGWPTVTVTNPTLEIPANPHTYNGDYTNLEIWLQGLADIAEGNSTGEYYVDIDSIGGTASDLNPGTITEPWETIEKANSTLVAGETVFIRSGTYNRETIYPSNSGSAGNYITYRNYQDELVSIVGGTQLFDVRWITYGIIVKDTSYINATGFTFLKPYIPESAHRARWFLLDNIDHVTLKNCIFKDGDEDFRYALSYMTDISYSKFDGCSWDASNMDINANAMQDLLDIKGTAYHNLWVDCDFGNISHNDVLFGTSTVEFNVFKNCTFHNKWRHGLTPNAGRYLTEGCTFSDMGTECDECPYWDDRCTEDRIPVSYYSFGQFDSIVRNNVFYNTTSPVAFGLQYRDAEDNWMYNNTIYNSLKYAGTSTHIGVLFGSQGGDTTVFHHNRILNNIFSESENTRQFELYNYNNSAYNPHDNIVSHNLIHDSTSDSGKWGLVTGTLAYVENNHSDWVAGTNIQLDPKFQNVETHDFTLESDSPAINAGTWLTTITSPTNTGQTAIVVGDATPFYSGAGAPWLIEGEVGDTIKTENGNETVIQSLDYTTNTLTVSPAIDVVNGEGLALTYSGSAPDMGAYQYEGDYTPVLNKLELSTNKHYLQDSVTGDPFRWMGIVPWKMPEMFDKADVDYFITEIRKSEHQYNVILTAIIMGRSCANFNPPNANGHVPFNGGSIPDFTDPLIVAGGTPESPNDFWDHMDYIVQECDKNGIYLCLLPWWANTYVHDRYYCGITITDTIARTYGEFLGDRYKDFDNIIWMLGGDGADPVVKGTESIYRAQAEGLLRGKTGCTTCPTYNDSSALWSEILMTYHGTTATTEGTRVSQLWDFATDKWLDLDGMYNATARRGDYYDVLTTGYELADHRSVDEVEGHGYWTETNPNWPPNFGGTKAFPYMHHILGGVGPSNLDQGWDCIYPEWKTILDLPERNWVGYFNNFMDTIDWWKLIPDNSIVLSAPGTLWAEIVAARSSDNNLILVSFSEEGTGTAQINLSDITTHSSARGTWWNTTDGTTQDAGLHSVTSNPTFVAPAGWDGAVLKLSGEGIAAPYSGYRGINRQKPIFSGIGGRFR